MENARIIVRHNFDGKKFMWLYAKYAYGANPNKHCTNSIKGKYSNRFTRNSPEFLPGQEIVLDEFPELNWDAIYICGVSRDGYHRHQNYPHNVHIAIIPKPGAADIWSFENWRMTVKNAIFEYVVSEDTLEEKYKNLPAQYRTCRMFRWAVTHYKDQLNKLDNDCFDKTLYG